jgi:hypothetical protein
MNPRGEDIVDGLVKGADPFFIGRNGTIELETLLFYRDRRSKGEPYPPHILERIEKHAGVWPATNLSIDDWCSEYFRGFSALNAVAAGWFAPLASRELQLMKQVAPDARHIGLRALEPYYWPLETRWTTGLAGKRVSVISSFTDTMQSQLGKDLWANQDTLLPPSTQWSFVKTGYAPSVAQGTASWPAEVKTWRDAVDYVVDTTLAQKPDVALIGCGGLGMVIATRLRRAGISVLVMGGAVQVLFGIKGNRWEKHPTIGQFWNGNWVYPSVQETPGAAGRIEGGCYWGVQSEGLGPMVRVRPST